jgi:hypothetical protein
MTFKILRSALLIILLIGGSSVLSINSVGAAPDLDRVEFQSSDNVTLVGRIDFPSGPGPFPAVAVVHGSGEVTRFENDIIPNFLNAAGFAVLRYDKRGVGDSGGFYTLINHSNSEFMYNLLSDDAVAAVEFLQTLPNIKSDQVGLFGGSQAGWIVPYAATKSENIAFTALISGPTLSVGVTDYHASLTGGIGTILSEERLEEVNELLPNYNGPQGLDPRTHIEQMTQPGIWVYGRFDESVPARASIEVLEEIRDELDKDISIHLYPTGNHNLRDVNTGAQLPYFPQIIVPWLQEQIEKLDS